MTETVTNHVYFAVFNFGDDPCLMTAILGIEPSEAWARGEPIANSNGNGKHTHSRWTLKSRLALTSPIEMHLCDVLEQLEPVATQVIELQRRFDARFCIATYGGNVGFELKPSILVKITALNCGIDIQFYQ